MNTIPTSTPFQVPGFNGADNNATPAEFLKFLRSLTAQYLGDDSIRVTSGSKDTWITIVDGLTDHLLGSFPQPDIVSWDTMKEKIVMTEATLEVIRRVFLRVDGIYDMSEDLVRKLFARLLDLCRVLGVWTEAEIMIGQDIISPKQLKERAHAVLISILRGLGNGSPVTPERHKPYWKTLRGILQECVDVCNDLMTPSGPNADCIIVSFFRKPRIISLNVLEPEPEQNPMNVLVAPPVQIPSFLALILDVIVKTMSPPLKCDWYLADIGRLTAEFSRAFLVHCLNSSFHTTSAIRAKTLMSIISTTTPMRNQPAYRLIIGDLLEYFLQLRLEAGLNLDWDIVDGFLIDALKIDVDMPVSQELIYATTHRLQMYNWGPENKRFQELLWSYLRCALPSISENLIATVKEHIAMVDQSLERDALLQQLSQYPVASVPVGASNGRLIIAPHLWRQRVRELVEEIIRPDTLSWMDDDEGSTLPHLCKRSLYEIQTRFEQREIEQSTESRLSIINKLADLQCLLAQCDKTDCLSQTTNNDFLTAGEYIPLISRLLIGTAEDVTPDCRRQVYNTLGFILKHHSGKEDVDYLIDPVFRGMADSDRSVRIGAGRALNGLVQTYGIQGSNGFSQAELIFTRLYQFFEISKNPIRETLLVTVGSMGKTSNMEILGQVLCLLIAQLGRQNPVIKGSACMHILAIARHLKKTPYSLILPYMNQVAPYIFKQLPVQPDLLREACRLMSIAPADFIVITLPRTLPELYAACDSKVLDTISKELSTKSSSLLLKHSHGILAHIFLLPNHTATTKALNFVIKVLTDATSSTIDIQSVVKSCIVPLLAELVVVMGDEDQNIAKQGVIALKRVEHILIPGKKGATPTSHLGAFLKNYMLGLISDINDMLQDVQGKKPVEMKRKILRSLGALVEQIGPTINNVSPQIMATFQTMVSIPELSEVTLESWYKFLTTLGTTELGPHIGPTSAAIVTSWAILSPRARDMAFGILEYVICTMGNSLHQHLAEIVDLSVVDDLRPLHEQLQALRGTSSSAQELDRILNQSSSDNMTVAMQALQELKTFMLQDHKEYIRSITSGDVFDPSVGRILASLLATACRDYGDGSEGLRLLSFECIGVLGAVDPDRCEIPSRNTSMVVMKNFVDEGEAVLFALHLIQDLLVGAFRSTSDIKYQSHLAYSIQELLKFCQFTPALVAAGNSTSVSIKARNRWNALPKHVLETVTPLLEARFTLNQSTNSDIQHPIYPTQSTYREWLQLWTTHLITKASGPTAQKLFGVFRSAVRNKDVVVAHHLLPHLVLNILISGNEDDAHSIRREILTVLEDQVDTESNSTSDKKLLSAQAVFMLLDHLNKWVRQARQEINKKGDLKRQRPDRMSVHLDEQLLRLDSILANIDQSLMAKAAFQCKAFARSLMNFERQIITLQERGGDARRDLPEYYERLHEIYAHLDEPDGMEGVSTLIVSPTLEHQIRQHESTGRWTSAQSCWEVRLQESPDDVEYHLGLLRCLRNLGHYDTLRTHVMGVLTRHPQWEGALAGFYVESAWMVGAWEDVQKLVERVDNNIPSIATGRILLAMRAGDADGISEALSQARSILGAPIAAAGVKGYRRSYDAVLDLHLTHELEVIYQTSSKLLPGSQEDIRQGRRRALVDLSRTLSARLDLTLPTFRSREPLLSMRRTAFGLSKNQRLGLNREIGKSWLASAKIGRKSKQWQTAYSAMLQAQQRQTPYCFIESAKLLQASGETLRALFELENSIKLHRLFDNQVVDLTSDPESERMKAKIRVLQARWMNECDRFDSSQIFNIFTHATELQLNWESAHYYLGQFQDDCFKAYSPTDQMGRGLKTNVFTIRSFAKAIMHGSKFVYQTVPRMLTIWLDLGEDKAAVMTDSFKKITDNMARAMKDAPVFKWFTAFPQIVSRVAHDNPEVYKILKSLIMKIIQEYPKQALWLFASVAKSTKENRAKRGNEILSQLRHNPRNRGTGLPELINESLEMTNQLLALCDQHVEEHKLILNMSKDFPKLKRLGNSNMIIPLQESLTASLPPTSASESIHQPFPLNTPTFKEFADDVEIMKSLAKPRKITIKGSNGQVYMFLGKPKDDLRKDARLMDLNAIINKLLKGNSESRRRQLHIRTYGVVALNEECGFIQWVPNTIPIRPVLNRLYAAKGAPGWNPAIGQVFIDLKTMEPQKTAGFFQEKILSIFKPVFHDWFIETFPEPSAWLASRMTYSRTVAVMSMVGFILGLGDRHCENILLDMNSGDIVHVDFNCLFEKGKTLETPERVPFRLTQNIVDGLGVSGVEGVFRISCEVTLQLLRDNKDLLMSVLDAFVHDPLVEWEDEKRKLERGTRKSAANAAHKVRVDTRVLAKNALNPIEKKLKGVYSPENGRERHEKELSTSNLVQLLIMEATDLANLSKMYVGWGPWH